MQYLTSPVISKFCVLAHSGIERDKMPRSVWITHREEEKESDLEILTIFRGVVCNDYCKFKVSEAIALPSGFITSNLEKMQVPPETYMISVGPDSRFIILSKEDGSDSKIMCREEDLYAANLNRIVQQLEESGIPLLTGVEWRIVPHDIAEPSLYLRGSLALGNLLRYLRNSVTW